MEASKPLASDAALRAYVRRIEAVAAHLYDDARRDGSVPWRELPPVERHDWILQAKRAMRGAHERV